KLRIIIFRKRVVEMQRMYRILGNRRRINGKQAVGRANGGNPPDASQGWQRHFPSAGRMNSLLALDPEGDDAVAVLLQGHAAVVISVGTSLRTHGSALGVIARCEGIGATRQTQRCEQQQYPHVALPQRCSGTNAAE
ncbi:MAG TPA: hypothetical protein VF760_05195, partial [Xanthobacteraceae bacterium]